MVTPLCVLLLKISGYLRNSDYAKNISFLLKEKKYWWNTKKKRKSKVPKEEFCCFGKVIDSVFKFGESYLSPDNSRRM